MSEPKLHLRSEGRSQAQSQAQPEPVPGGKFVKKTIFSEKQGEFLKENCDFNNKISISVPGKVFLFGEYGVLAGLPAVVATVGPRFEMITPVEPEHAITPTPNSPWDRLVRFEARVAPPAPATNMQSNVPTGSQYTDPYRGEGGFGASTAQFAMEYLAWQKRTGADSVRWKSAWGLYRELMADGAFTPSGADLVAQWQGGVIVFDPKPGHESVADLWPLMDWSGLLVFSAASIAGRKTATHRHLSDLSSELSAQELFSDWTTALEPVILDGVLAIRDGDVEKFGKVLDRYAEELFKLNLESPAAREDRNVLRQLPGVLGVKGCGALLSDAVLVSVVPGENKERVIATAEARGLRLISEGLNCEMGVTCQSL